MVYAIFDDFESPTLGRDAALRIQDGTGYIAGNPVERFYRDARVTRIYEGATEIHRGIIGRAMPRR